MGPKSGWGGPVGIGYVRPVQFLDHLTVIRMWFALRAMLSWHFQFEDSFFYSPKVVKNSEHSKKAFFTTTPRKIDFPKKKKSFSDLKFVTTAATGGRVKFLPAV